MVAGKSPEWLPSGFTEKVKYRNGRKTKYYYNDATGTSYYSKKDVLSCARAENVVRGTPQGQTSDGNDKGISSNGNVEACDEVHVISTIMSGPCTDMANTDGIHKEKKDDGDMTVRSLTSPKLDLCTDIEEEKGGDSSKTIDKADEPSPLVSSQNPWMKKPGCTPGKKRSSFTPVSTVISAADGLPPGWIKEIVTSKSGSKTRLDPYYIDPVSGYVFRSKPDALRYINTNDIRYCVIKPRKRDSDCLNLLTNEVQSLSSSQAQLLDPQKTDGEDVNTYREGSGVVKPPPNHTLRNEDTVDTHILEEPENETLEDKPEQPPPHESGSEKETRKKIRPNSKKTMKRKDPVLASRSSKRLNTTPNYVASEPSLEPSPETPKETQPPNRIENLTENAPSDGPTLHKEESELGFDFGDSWSNPLEFAVKTLRGDIPIGEMLSGYFDDNNNGCNNNPSGGGRLSSSSDVGNIGDWSAQR